MLLQTSADGHSLLTLLALAAWTTFRAFKEASWCIGCVWKWNMIYLPPSYGHVHREHDDESILKGLSLSNSLMEVSRSSTWSTLRRMYAYLLSWNVHGDVEGWALLNTLSCFCSSSRATQRLEIMRWYGPWNDTNPKDSALSWSYDVIPINFRAPDATFLLLTPSFPLAFKDRIQTRKKSKANLMSEYLWLKFLLSIFPTC